MVRCLSKPAAVWGGPWREAFPGPGAFASEGHGKKAAPRTQAGAAAEGETKGRGLFFLLALSVLLLAAGALLFRLTGAGLTAGAPGGLNGSAATLSAGRTWSGIVDVIAERDFTIGLRRDGTVVFAGNDYSGAGKRIASWRNIARIELSSGRDYVIGYRWDGTVALEYLSSWGSFGGSSDWREADFASWKDVKQLLISTWYCLALHGDGTVSYLAGEAESRDALRPVAAWKNIEQLAMNDNLLVVGLKSDGTVVSTNDRALSEEGGYWGGSWGSKENWKGIKTLASSFCGIYAVKWDGTVLGMGRKGWNDIESLCFASDSMFGLRRDGTVATNFSEEYSGDPRLKEIAGWTHIVQLGFDNTGFARYVPVGLCADGTVCAVTRGYDGEAYGEWNFSGWSRVKTLYSGTDYTIGLRGDGTLLVTGGEFGTLDYLGQVSRWKDIAAIYVAPGDYEEDHIIGLKSDGTLVAAGNNDKGQCEVTR